MRRFLSILPLMALLSVSCLKLDGVNPYEGAVSTLELRLTSDQGALDVSGVTLTVTEQSSSMAYTKATDAAGKVVFNLPNGIYNISTSAVIFEGRPYMASGDAVLSFDNKVMDLPLKGGRLGNIVIKEIYCGGCMKLPEEGSYNYDSYVILHNNAPHTAYLDGLCFGTLDPYNSNASNVWPANYGFAPVIQAIWSFPGTGMDFPLEPGEDAVMVIYGAIDHSAQYPLSVNLDKEGYFVCYNTTYFTNTAYHPAPGGNIGKDHYMEIPIKLGKANAYTFSQNSPAAILFRPEGTTMEEFLGKSENVVLKPGTSDERIALIPNEWIEDGVEVFNGQSGSNKKRLNPIVDCSSVVLSQTKAGRTLMRSVDDDASALAGYEVLKDSNNSKYDFYERETQSLHE